MTHGGVPCQARGVNPVIRMREAGRRRGQGTDAEGQRADGVLGRNARPPLRRGCSEPRRGQLQVNLAGAALSG